MRLRLASASPRRADLLRAAGILFEVAPAPAVDERLLPGEPPERAAARLAALKAQWDSGDPAEIVLGADTIVVIQGTVLGKPVDDGDALRMLRLLSGRSHQVFTGLCVRHGAQSLVHVEETGVRFSPLTDEEMSWYVATGEYRDKAGGYAVQGLASRFVAEIHGSYSNVVGLPISRVYELLKALGCDILGFTTTRP